jgi:capsular exopolysaccharide synthesis family protein
MLVNKPSYEEQKPQVDDAQKVERLLFRILPYWPLVLIAVTLGWLGGYIYLRYQVPVYSVNAKLLVNDDTQQKNTNLGEMVSMEYKDVSVETEREMQVLTSRDLLGRLIAKLQLNVLYTQEGLVKTSEQFSNIPVKLVLESPDSIKASTFGEVEVVNGGRISFGGIVYPVDSMVTTEFGRVRFHINESYITQATKEKSRYYISIIPVSDYVGAVQGGLNIAPISEGSSTLKITYNDASPSRGVLILDTLISLYEDFTLNNKSKMSANTLRFLDSRLLLIANELGGVEKNLANFKANQGIVDLGVEGGLSLSRLKDADVKMAELGVQLDVINEIQQYVSRRNKSNNPVPATLGIADPVLTGQISQLYQLESDLQRTIQVSGVKNPQVEVYEEQIARLKPGILSSLNNLKISLQSGRQGLQVENSRVMSSLSKIPQKERLLLDISRQQSIKNAIYTYLLQKREEAALAASAILPNSRIIEKPQSAGQIYPVPMRNYTAGILAGLFLSAVFIFFKEFAGRRVLYRSQIEDAIPVPVIAEIIFQPNRNDSPIVVAEGKRTMIAEQFRELRTNINFITSHAESNSKVILITSSVPKEGKSFIAINTAITLTLTGAKVAIIEADLRNPKISGPLGITGAVGMSNYLIGKASLDEITYVHPTFKNLSIIPAGSLPPNPAELLSTSRLTDLIYDLKQRFDFVIIDSPPVAAVTDSKILAKVADATLYIIRYKYTNQNLLNLIRDNYQNSALPNIYIVFNGIVNKQFLGYAYGKGYGAGYGYTAEDKQENFFSRILKRKIKV